MESILLFDLFGVFLRYRNLAHDEAVLAKCSVSAEKVREFFFGDSWRGYNLGRLNDSAFEKSLQQELGYWGTVEEFGENFFKSVSLETGLYDFLQELRLRERGWDKWLLSNVCPVFYRLARARYPGLFASFGKVFLSFEMGLRKPDPEIFKKVIREARQPASFIFLDDFPENLEGARKCGMRTILFTPDLLENNAIRLRTIFRRGGMAHI